MPYRRWKSSLQKQKVDLERWTWAYIADFRYSTLHKAIEIYHKIFKEDEMLFIIDDCSATKELNYRKHENNNKCMINELAFNGRHANHSCWILSQKYNSVLKDFREQRMWLCIFYCKDRNSFENCSRENDVVPDEETRKEICLKLKRKKHSKLILTCSRRAYYIFFGPPCGIIFSENFEQISSP